MSGHQLRGGLQQHVRRQQPACAPAKHESSSHKPKAVRCGLRCDQRQYSLQGRILIPYETSMVCSECTISRGPTQADGSQGRSSAQQPSAAPRARIVSSNTCILTSRSSLRLALQPVHRARQLLLAPHDLHPPQISHMQAWTETGNWHEGQS